MLSISTSTESEELIQLLQTPCEHDVLRRASLFSCLTGLRISDEAMPQNVTRLEEKVHVLTETVNKLSQHIFSIKAPAKDKEMICVEEASKLLHLSPSLTCAGTGKTHIMLQPRTVFVVSPIGALPMRLCQKRRSLFSL